MGVEVGLVNNPNQSSQHILYQSAIVTVGISGTVSERGRNDLLLAH